MNNVWIFYAVLIVFVGKIRNLYRVVIGKSPPPDRNKFWSFKILSSINYVITISFPKTHPANIETHFFQVSRLCSLWNILFAIYLLTLSMFSLNIEYGKHWRISLEHFVRVQNLKLGGVSTEQYVEFMSKSTMNEWKSPINAQGIWLASSSIWIYIYQ